MMKIFQSNTLSLTDSVAIKVDQMFAEQENNENGEEDFLAKIC